MRQYRFLANKVESRLKSLEKKFWRFEFHDRSQSKSPERRSIRLFNAVNLLPERYLYANHSTKQKCKQRRLEQLCHSERAWRTLVQSAVELLETAPIFGLHYVNHAISTHLFVSTVVWNSDSDCFYQLETKNVRIHVINADRMCWERSSIVGLRVCAE